MATVGWRRIKCSICAHLCTLHNTIQAVIYFPAIAVLGLALSAPVLMPGMSGVCCIVRIDFTSRSRLIDNYIQEFSRSNIIERTCRLTIHFTWSAQLLPDNAIASPRPFPDKESRVHPSGK